MELKLSVKDRGELESLVAAPQDAKQLKRAQGLLAVADGERPTAIARRLGVTRATVYEWVKRWRERTEPPAERLRDQPRAGRPPVVREALHARLPALLDTKPTAEGYRQAEWTTGLLQRHLARQQIVASDGSLRQALHRLGYRWKRPRYVLRRRSPTWRQSKGGSSAA
jgi:transposase